MNKKQFIAITFLSIIIGIFIGMGFQVWSENNILMKDYDLYHCIYNNAYANNFNKNPTIIKKIQDECICFREYNYTNLLEADCSNETKTKSQELVN